MFLHDMLKQLVLASVALSISAYLWKTFTAEYTAKVAESIKNQKPMEFKRVEFEPAFDFNSNPKLWQPPTINLNDFQPKSSSRSSKARSLSSPRHR